MTRKEIEELSSEIVRRIFEKLEDDARTLHEDPQSFIDILIDDEQQIKELELLIKYYENNEDYTKAAAAFNQLKILKKIKKDNEQNNP